VTRQGAKDYFDNSWTLFEMLFAGLKGDEPFYRPPVHGLRHPQIFYYGHTPCLYINKLRVAGVLADPVNPYFESIFEVGVDEMLWDDMVSFDICLSSLQRVRYALLVWISFFFLLFFNTSTKTTWSGLQLVRYMNTERMFMIQLLMLS